MQDSEEMKKIKDKMKATMTCTLQAKGKFTRCGKYSTDVFLFMNILQGGQAMKR
jgi:hypothetical protein